MTEILLKNACILDVDKGVVNDACDVLIVNGRIAEIGAPRLRSDTARPVDLGGRVLMPGLCDAHVHVIVPINSFAALTKWSPFYTAIRAMPILEGMLMRGFTTVRDCGGADFGLAKAVSEGLIPGPRILFSGKALSQTGGHGDMRAAGELPYDDHPGVPALGRICDGVPAVRAAARDELRRGAHQVKIMAGGGIASYTDPVTNDQFSREEIAAAVEEAAMCGKYVVAHAYTARSIARCVELGVRSIEHGNFLDDPTAKLMADRSAIFVPTLVALDAMAREGLEVGMPPELHAKIDFVMREGTKCLEVAARNNVKMVFGTDLIGPLHRHQADEFRIRAAVLPPVELIRSATCYAAELFNMVGEIGTVAPGAQADLVAVDGNPLDDIGLLQDQGSHFPLIMKGGQIFKNRLA
jgi:imidazolonepropionase-like amidohydrolase